jgi:sec-independent protein translocase protein TatA
MLSMSHILLVLLIILIVFGAGKLPQVMGDVAKGIKNFRDNLKQDENNQDKKIDHKDKKND